MYSLFRSLDTGAEAGTPLPTVWRTLETAGIRQYRGDVSMVAGPPGSGKSVLALQTAIESGVPTLYVSCDMGPQLTAARSAAILTGRYINDIREELSDNTKRSAARVLLSDRVHHVYMAHESRPSPEKIEALGLAFGELWGHYPELIVIDNTMNLFSGNENEWTGLRELSHVMHYFAQDWGSHVMALHHVNLAGMDPTVPAPLGALKGQISELPALILHIAKWNGQLRIAAVKNRNGNADPSGRKYVTLTFDEPRGTLRDPEPEPLQTSWVPNTVPDWFAQGVND
jgi:hypothetical protein